MNIELSTYQSRISDFISQMPRNKLVIVKDGIDDIDDIQFLNIGDILSNSFVDIITHTQFSLKAKDIIAQVLDQKSESHNELGKYLAISNIGILLEEELKFDFKSFLDTYSNDQVLLLKWEGLIENNKLYFLTKQNGIEIDISDLSHIII